MKRILGGSIRRRSALIMWRALVSVPTVSLFSLACGQWKTLPSTEIEAHPEKLSGEKVRVHFHVATMDTTAASRERSRSQREGLGSGTRSVADSILVVHVDRVAYPVLHGVTMPEAKLGGKTASPEVVSITLKDAYRTDLRETNVLGTLGLLYLGYIAVTLLGLAAGWWPMP